MSSRKKKKRFEDIDRVATATIVSELVEKYGRARWAVVYVHHNCPICQSIFRISMAGLVSRTVPVYFVNVESTSIEERLAVWGFTLGPYGLSMRITVPMLVVWEVDRTGKKRIVYKREIRPLRGPVLGQEEIKELFFEVKGFLRPEF